VRMQEAAEIGNHWWRGFRTITHPSGYRPDEAAGHGACTVQPPRRCTTQCRRYAVEVPRNPLPLSVLVRPSVRKKVVLVYAPRSPDTLAIALLLFHSGDDAPQPSHFLHQFQHDPVHQRVTLPGSALDARKTLLGQVAVARCHRIRTYVRILNLSRDGRKPGR